MDVGSAKTANGYHEPVGSSEEDAELSDLSKSSSLALQETRGCCNAPCCCHTFYILLFLVYLVIFPLWGKWLVTAPMPYNFWHDNLPAFPLLAIKDFDIARRRTNLQNSPDISMSAIPSETSACNYTCGEMLLNFRSNLMNFPVEMTLEKKDLAEENAHTTYPVLMASEDFEHWQLVGDRRNAYPDPFWRSHTVNTGNTYTMESTRCTVKPSGNFSAVSRGMYVMACITWHPLSQQMMEKADAFSLSQLKKYCTLTGGSCGWPCGSNVPSDRLEACDANSIIDTSQFMEETDESLGKVRITACTDSTTDVCTTSSLPLPEWECQTCAEEQSAEGDDEDEDDDMDMDDMSDDTGSMDDMFRARPPAMKVQKTKPPPVLPLTKRRRRLQDDEDDSMIVRYKSLPRLQVRLENAQPPPHSMDIVNAPRAFILASHKLNGKWVKLFKDTPTEFPLPLPASMPNEHKPTDPLVINAKDSMYEMTLERKNTLRVESDSCFGKRGPMYLVACAVNSSIYDDEGLWLRNKDEARFLPGQRVAGPPFNDRCLAVSGRCGFACVSQQQTLPYCRPDGYIDPQYLTGDIDLEFNRVPAVLAFVCVLLCGFTVKTLMLCPGIFSPYRHAHAYEPEMTECIRYIIIISPVAGADENKGTMLRNLVGVVSAMPPDCRCRYHCVVNDEGHRNEMKICWLLMCKVMEEIPNFGDRSYEENLLEFTHLWCQETKVLGLKEVGGKVKALNEGIVERLSGMTTLSKLLKESKWSTFEPSCIAPLKAAIQDLMNDLSTNYNKFTISIPYLDNIGDWEPKDPTCTALRCHYTSRAKPVEDSRNIMVQHVAVGSWFYKVPRHATTEDWLQLRTNCKEMVYAVPDHDADNYQVPLRSSHGKAGGLNFVDNYMSVVARRPENIYGDEKDEAPTLYAIADARHQYQPDFMISCIPCFFTEAGDLNNQVAFTQAPQHYPEYADKDDYMDYNNAQFFRLNAMIRNCCGGVSSCGTNGMWLVPARDDDTIWQKRRKRVRDRDSRKRDELIEREQFHTSCKIEDTASSLDQVLVGRHSHFVNRKLSFGMAKAPTDFIGAQQRWVEGAVTLSLQWFSFNADAHGLAAKNAWMLWVTILCFLSYLGTLIALVCYSGDVTDSLFSGYPVVTQVIRLVQGQLAYWMENSTTMFQLMGGNDLSQDIFVNLFLQFFIWMAMFMGAFTALWFLTTVCNCFQERCSFPNEMRWWGRLIISMDNLTYFLWFWTSFFWIGFNYYTALCKMDFHFNNKGMMGFMLCVNSLNWMMIIANTFRYNVMESMDANEIAALSMDNIWRSNQLFFMTGPIQLFSFVRGIGEFIKYRFYGQDIGGWSGGDLGTVSVNIVKYWTTLMLLGCVMIWTAHFVYAKEYQNSFSACIVVTLISLDVLHPCVFLWLGNVFLSKQEISKMSWTQCLTDKRWWQVKVKDFILNTTFTSILKYLAPSYFLVLPILALFSSYFGVSGAYLLVAMGPGH